MTGEAGGEAELLGVSELRAIARGEFQPQTSCLSCYCVPALPPPPPQGRRASPHHMQIVGKFTSVSF